MFAVNFHNAISLVIIVYELIEFRLPAINRVSRGGIYFAFSKQNNKAHVSTRVEIELSFGWWKWRFHVLHSEGRMKHEKTCQIISACAVLHNIAILLKEPQVDYQLDEDNQPDMVAYCGPETGKLIRDHICERRG